MTAPKPKLETTTTPQDSEPTPSEVVDVHNLTLEAALKIVRELIDREESKGSIASQPMRCHFDRSEPTPLSSRSLRAIASALVVEKSLFDRD